MEQHALPASRTAVFQVARNGMPTGSKLHPDLVRPPGNQFNPEQGRLPVVVQRRNPALAKAALASMRGGHFFAAFRIRLFD